MTQRLFMAQRLSAFVLALTVAVHLSGILFAASHELTAGEILARTRGNMAVMAFYGLFVVAVAIHAPIGLRNVVREWTSWRGKTLDGAAVAFAIVLLVLGMRAVAAVTMV